MGISFIRIRNFKSAKKIDYDFSKAKVHCLLGKNGVGKTTIDNAIMYFYDIANNPYALKDVIDKKNPYLQKTIIELCFDFSRLLGEREHNEYIDNDIKEYEDYIIGNRLVIRLTQYKNGEIEWYPINDRYKVAKILKIFPVYMVKTRNIDARTWDELWDTIADIAITGIKESKTTIWERLRENFREIYGSKYVKVLDSIENILKRERLSINENDFKKRFKNALMTNMGGEIFMLDDQSLDYYSDGINTLRYLSLLINILAELSKLSWKEIMVVLDEPEISLHLQFIEELSDVIVSSSNRISFLLTTHSTRLISSLLKEVTGSFKIVCNQIYIKNGYTCIKKIHDIVSDKDKYLIRDNEAESYFANAMIFVEGQTEVQVLKNRNLVNLFPFLKKVTIYNTESNDSATKLIRPPYNNPAIPFLVLLDMDKVLVYSSKKEKFKLTRKNTTVNPLSSRYIKEKEQFLYYGRRKEATNNKRKKINEELKKRIKVDTKNYYNQLPWYDELIDDIKDYSKEYRTIIFKTTVEGAIICEESLEIVHKWLEDYWGSTKSRRYFAKIAGLDRKAQILVLRAIFHGKTDYLSVVSPKSKSVPPNIKTIIDSFTEGKKTDGWLLNFFDWFFARYMHEDYIYREEYFSETFPEIYEVVHYVEHMLE